MALFRSREAKLQRALTKDVRLLLPTAPDPDQLLAAARLFSPDARLISGSRLAADEAQHVILLPATAVDQAAAAAAGLPAGITAAYFVHIDADVALPGRPGDALTDRYQAMKREKISAAHALAYCFINGLATRFGGAAYPVPKAADDPLHADVYTALEPDQPELAALVARHLPGLAPAETEWSRRGVVTLRADDARFEVEYWPSEVVRVPLTEHAADGADPFSVVTEIIKPSGRGLHAITVRAAEPARGADPELARALGQAALGLAGDTDGVCIDVFGFRVLRPDDLIIRPAVR